INAHKTWICCRGFKAKQRLSKHLLLGEAPQHLAEIASLDAASGSGIRLSAAFAFTAKGFCFVHCSFCSCDFVAQAVREERVAKLAKVLAPADFCGNGRCMAEFRCMHQLEILFILTVVARGDFVEPLGAVAMIRAA